MGLLYGKRILLVEDEVLIAEMVVEMLAGLGASVIGPATTLEQGLELARSHEVDAAVLDVNLRGERIDPISELLAAKGVPILFATGYGTAPGAVPRDAAVVDKPYTQERLASGLVGVMAMPRRAGPAA